MLDTASVVAAAPIAAVGQDEDQNDGGAFKRSFEEFFFSFFCHHLSKNAQRHYHRLILCLSNLGE